MAPLLTAQQQSLRWDCTLVLNINPSNHIFTCVGKTKANLPCKNSIKQSDRDKANEILGLLCQVSPDQVKPEQLVAVANPLLCTRWHRGAQDYEKASEWYRMLKTFIANPPQPKQEDHYYLQQEIQALKKQLTAEKHLREANNAANAADTEQLKDELQKSRSDKIFNMHKYLELHEEYSSVKERLEEKQQSNRHIQDELSECKRALVDKDGQLRLAHEELASGNVALMEKSIEIDALKEKNTTLEQTLKEQEVKHDACVTDLHSQLQNKDKALLDMIRQRNRMETTLNQHVQDAAAEATELKSQNRRLKIRLHLHTFTAQAQMAMKQCRYEEVIADNQALLEQQKLLQQDLSGLIEMYTDGGPSTPNTGIQGLRMFDQHSDYGHRSMKTNIREDASSCR
ncbi:MAG: hypothetical protein Q9217_004369 [Psora testacea]